ncbi:MAG: hypothetical protein WCP73_10290 [Eubacteriales bacterium]
MGKLKLDGRLFLPRTVDNTFRGIAAAKYVFFAIAAITVVRSLLHILLPDGGAQSIATIPLQSYGLAAAGTVVYMFGTWGLTQLIMGAVYWVVALRYKSLIPLMYACVAAEYAGRIAIGHTHPVALIGTAPGEIANYVLLPLAGVMMLLSLIYRERRSPESRMR